MLETGSGGRRQAGLRWETEPGADTLWLRPSYPGKTNLRYQLRADFDAEPAPEVPEAPAEPAAGPSEGTVCIEIVASPDLNHFNA